MGDRGIAGVLATHYSPLMGDETTAWSVSTSEGVALDAEELPLVLAAHHERLMRGWREFTADQWHSASRNERWSVHETVRHVADAMERGAGAADADDDVELLDQFDPRSTPNAWLEGSNGESPAATVERFDVAARRFRDAVQNRLASDDDSRATTVYGDAHWTMNVAHLLWDSWIHERDVLLPLGIQQSSPRNEERLVGLYGVFMSAVPSKLFEQTMSATVELVGHKPSTLSVSFDGQQIICEENPRAATAATAEHGTAIDALAGRGLAVDEALPGAPPELGLLAAFFNS
jgi:hypothetical protein